jgi:ribosomal protein S18 acetylase RimI-like enzyme
MTKDEKKSLLHEIRFREAADGDRARLIELINAAFSIETFLEGTRTDEQRLSAMMAKGTILMAEDTAGRLLGSIYMEDRGQRGYLGMLAVDPARQRGGLGRRLMAETENRLREQGCKAVDIIVLNLRPELPPIYERFGYAITGTEEFKPSRTLKQGAECHGILMTKRL